MTSHASFLLEGSGFVLLVSLLPFVTPPFFSLSPTYMLPDSPNCVNQGNMLAKQSKKQFYLLSFIY